jgi:hypothetical protein
VADDHLHDNGVIEASGEWTEYEMLAVGEVGGLGHTSATWTVGQTQLVQTRKELDPRPLYIGGMDLVI